MSKKDDINRLYDVSAVLGKVNNILFFVNMILSFLSLVCETKAGRSIYYNTNLFISFVCNIDID